MEDTAVEVPTRVLVFGMARPDGTIVAADLYDVATACDQTSEQVRSCLRRLVAEGLLAREGSGRKASYRTTPAGDRLRAGTLDRHRLAYLQDRRDRDWDGRWHLAAFAVPEGRRAARDRLRDHLLDAGGAVVHNGLYVSAHPWEDSVTATAAALDVTDCLSLATSADLAVGGTAEPRALARALWPIDEIADDYRRFVEANHHVLAVLEDLQERRGRISDAEFLPGALRMVVAFQSVFRRDPLLPPALLPQPWPGREARELLITSRRLGLRLRADHERPALFSAFDDLLELAR